MSLCVCLPFRPFTQALQLLFGAVAKMDGGMTGWRAGSRAPWFFDWRAAWREGWMDDWLDGGVPLSKPLNPHQPCPCSLNLLNVLSDLSNPKSV